MAKKKNPVDEVWGEDGIYDDAPPVAYCVKDKDLQFIKKPELVRLKNGKIAITGTCPECGSKLFKIMGKGDVIPPQLRKQAQGIPPPMVQEQIDITPNNRGGYTNQEELPQDIVVP